MINIARRPESGENRAQYAMCSSVIER